MSTKRTLLLLTLVGLLGAGCASEDDAYTNSYPDEAMSNDAFPDQRGTQPLETAFGTQNDARLHQAAARPRGDNRFQRYTEQREQAYSFEAPAGWNVQAQIIRRSPTSYRLWNVVNSPDGQIHIVSGLPPQYVFIEPNPTMAQLGFGEGSSPDGNLVIARYQRAATFAQYHAQLFTQGCRNLQIIGQRERPDDARRLVQKAQEAGTWISNSSVDAAEVHFTCEGPQGPLEGRLATTTTRMQIAGGVSWVGGVRAYLAPPSRSEEAYQIMEHMEMTQQTNPQWRMRQQQAQQAQTQANQQAHQQRMAQQQASFNAHQQRMAQNQAAFNATQQSFAEQRAAFDASVQSWQNNQVTQSQMHDQFIGSIRDETRVWDTNTGQYYDVANGSDNYYIDNSGSTIIGTPGYMDNPDPMNYNQMYEGYDYEGGDNR